jgi:hypothetical protein
MDSENPTACRDRRIHLVRTTGEDILLQNRNSGLPLNNECDTAPTGEQFPRQPLTKSDDRLFRLTRMPLAACQP